MGAQTLIVRVGESGRSLQKGSKQNDSTTKGFADYEVFLDAFGFLRYVFDFRLYTVVKTNSGRVGKNGQ